jgi:hypothetical protein
MTREDPIVEEVRATRERLLHEAGGFDIYIARLKALEVTEEAPVVSNVVKQHTMLEAAKCAEDHAVYRK